MLDQTSEEAQTPRTGDKQGEPSNRERRELFKRLGKYAVYTAPVVIAVLASEKGYAVPMPYPSPPPPPPPPPPS